MESQAAGGVPAQTELVIGFVAAVGIDLQAIVTTLRSVLSEFDYRCHDLHLTDQLRALDWDVDLKEAPYDERVWSYMTAGNRLRGAWERDDAFALLAVNAITVEREKLTGNPEVPADRQAYLLRSLKRTEEAQLLRDVYGSRFVLLSIYSPKDERRRLLERKIRESRVVPFDAKPIYSAKKLIKRDESEAIEHGQDVRGIFHRGDFFIDATADSESQMRRIMEILFGHPQRLPTRDEFGMFQAAAASRRSAELGREVGSAISTVAGDVIAVGTNEVPRGGGGLYSEGDAREFTMGVDTSDRRKSRIARAIAKDLKRTGYLKKGVGTGDLRRRIERTDLGNLEFIRAVHAEMVALMDAARRGISVADTVMYVTTFPCHHCARHVAAAGIKRVVYIAPYPKSLAGGLHQDSIAVDPPHGERPDSKVTFEPFVGVGPSRYLDLFEMLRKSRRTGKVTPFRPKKANPRLAEIEPPEMVPKLLGYIRREERALDLLVTVQDGPGRPRLGGLEFDAPAPQ